MNTFVLYLNLIIALGSSAFGMIALYRPKMLVAGADGGAGERFFVLMYAARTVPFGCLAGFLPLFASGWTIAVLLGAAALIQVADIVIALRRRTVGMAIGATIAASVHVAAIFLVL